MFSQLQGILTPVKAGSAVIVQSLHGSKKPQQKTFPISRGLSLGRKKKIKEREWFWLLERRGGTELQFSDEPIMISKTMFKNPKPELGEWGIYSDYLPLVRQGEDLPAPPLLGYPQGWEGRRNKCKMRHRGGTDRAQQGESFPPLLGKKDSFSRAAILLMKDETPAKNFGWFDAPTALWKSRIRAAFAS